MSKKGGKINMAPRKSITSKDFEESSGNSDKDMNLSNDGNEQEATENPSDEDLRGKFQW